MYDVYSWVHFKTTQTLISIFGNDGSREKTFAERFVCKTNSNMGWVKIQVVGLWMAVEQVVVDLGYILVLHLDSLVILLLSWGWCLNIQHHNCDLLSVLDEGPSGLKVLASQ